MRLLVGWAEPSTARCGLAGGAAHLQDSTLRLHVSPDPGWPQRYNAVNGWHGVQCGERTQ